MDLGLKDKVAIVTGGAAGIGKATVEVLLEEGAIPVIVDMDNIAGQSVAKKASSINSRTEFFQYDLREDDNCKTVIRETVYRLGRIDILINNAGGNDFRHIATTSPAEFRESLNQNLVSAYAMCHYAWLEIAKTQGNIVFVGSKVSLTGEGRTAAYAAAKAGINGLTRELAVISAKENLGIRVNAILPGKVDTYVEKLYPGKYEKGLEIEGRDIPFGKRITYPREIANAIAFYASNRVSGHTTGEIVVVDGGYVHLDRNAHL